MERKRTGSLLAAMLFLLLGALLPLALPVQAAETTSYYPLGDTDGNGVVNVRDAMQLYLHASGAAVLSTAQLDRSDMDGNGRINMLDVQMLYTIASGGNPTLATTTRGTTTTTTAVKVTTTTTTAPATTTRKPAPPTTVTVPSDTTTTTSSSATTTVTTDTSTTLPTDPQIYTVGVDVSYAQGTVDWETLQPNIDFAILRCGYGQDEEDQDDEEWERNAAECERLGIPYGAYLFCYARNEQEALGEAEHALRLLEGKTLTYPIYLDMEDSRYQGDLSPDTCAAIATVFCETLQQAGYKVGVYANLYWWENKLTAPCFDNWYRWIAQYNDVCEYEGVYQMWQYTDTGEMDGIGTLVDLNVGYIDPSLLSSQLTAMPAPQREGETADEG